MFKNIRHRRFIFRILMDIHEYTLWEVGYSGSLQDIANILEYPQEQVLFSGKILHFIIYLYTYKTLITLIVCMFEAVHTIPGYGMATLIYNNLLNLILVTVMLLIKNYLYHLGKGTFVFIQKI